MSTHPSDTAQVAPVTLLETVQARGETVTRERHTVQDTSKLPGVYVLRGETVVQKLLSFQQYVAANLVFGQLELLGYIEDMLSAPVLLETTEVLDAAEVG